VAVRRTWPEVLESVKSRRRFSWILLSQNAQVAALDAGALSVAFVNAGARDSFVNSGSDEILHQALIDVLGVDWQVECIVDPSGGSAQVSGTPGMRGARPATSPGPASVSAPVESSGGQPAGPPAARRAAPAGERGAPSRPERRSAVPRAAVAPEDDVAADDDPDVDDAVSGHELVQRELGARIISEFENT
jgi:DNA polymerase-3 subunit gamma/tau